MSWMLTMVISPSTGMVPEWLETTRAPPVGGDVLGAAHLDPEPLLGDRDAALAIRKRSVTSASKPYSSTS